MYHPAALERAADSINGVETQGLGRSGDGMLPIIEDSWAFLEVLRCQMGTSSRWLLNGSVDVGNAEGRRILDLVSDGAQPNTGAQMLSSWCPSEWNSPSTVSLIINPRAAIGGVRFCCLEDNHRSLRVS